MTIQRELISNSKHREEINVQKDMISKALEGKISFEQSCLDLQEENYHLKLEIKDVYDANLNLIDAINESQH